ncbi:hypothetical protein GSI_01418 [Ganoderma sinense ZZ0214-1]|uniref:Uncharacterized protein n=1 Tax=Ganoderma sinense ZZ0214-1 TaxID=1077348 RepID=A0A2G8SVD7_9APHY|nr:hypothetical protein GSI_01418 [Ganoderma sinense ZZ0214-1]
MARHPLVDIDSDPAIQPVENSSQLPTISQDPDAVGNLDSGRVVLTASRYSSLFPLGQRISNGATTADIAVNPRGNFVVVGNNLNEDFSAPASS